MLQISPVGSSCCQKCSQNAVDKVAIEEDAKKRSIAK